jgi:Asp-tRNA(Asn)/Glu-tRNA(Gln) amidotransferase A subunit family amidase
MISGLADLVRSGTVSAEALVDHALQRIGRDDPSLNAVVAVRADEALEEARSLDARIRRGEDPGLLAGLPVLVKDVHDVAGMPTTFGSALFADAPPAESDGHITARLRAAGAIVVGKTNTPEFATEGFTANLVFGATSNPWGQGWSPGGSSGGSAAALAAGMVPIATATDGGGSIRIPAAFCGLVGLKPTNGVIGRSPIPDWIDFSTDGPLAASVADLRLQLAVLAGPVPGDPTALPRPWPGAAVATTTALGRPATQTRAALAAPRFTPWGPLPAAVAAAFEAALRAWERTFKSGVEPVEPEALFRSGNPDTDWFVLATAEHVNRLGRDKVTANLERFHPAARWFLEEGLTVSIDDYLAARRRRFDYVRELDELLGEDGVILTPTVASEGWLADGRLPGAGDAGALPAHVYNTAVQNVTGHPAVSLPAGRLPNGLPFGLQVTGPRFRDDMLLELAEAWEQANPWPAVAPGYQPFDAGL